MLMVLGSLGKVDEGNGVEKISRSRTYRRGGAVFGEDPLPERIKFGGNELQLGRVDGFL
jgi:hypothetical protein